ncbi:hypothetical protein M2150_002202 [Lachnospiraceae bacterium PM6-15]|uniref:DUF1292 domain-containing protein n=1 Tax=Ohessyouella blattaphilus TaxID=2949333 RepID=A0ABT1EGW6_9FIRM|nr:DUF1292 domain-containing protein [Ohessyouella blattaphilus]MCP1109946.1 DUF1292 domain-containing protein [Ohessyouella blattaphilus]MCR8563340.1 DUF1292 domain-containing protein [Ohessyouella blattaphilus]
MEKITFMPADSDEAAEFFVLEQTRLGGIPYILVADSLTDDAQALILKDTSEEEASEAVYEIVEDDDEIDSVIKIFEELLEDVSVER